MRRRRRAVICSFLLCALGAAAGLRAHDFWIEPSSFTPAPGQRIAVRLRVGQGFRGDPVPRDLAVIERFVARSGGGGPGGTGEQEIPGVRGGEPAGFPVFAVPGLYQLVYASRPSPLELDGAKFERYLADEGLEEISRLRARRGETAAPARELFSRCAKSLVTVGGGPRSGFDQPLGLTLELVPEGDPVAVPPGGALPLRLLYRGKPLAGALVTAVPHDHPEAAASGRTDRHGRVKLRLAQGGLWLVKAVHMIPAGAATRAQGAEWESFWASLTFATAGR